MPWESVLAVLASPEIFANDTVDTLYTTHKQDDRLTLLVISSLIAVGIAIFVVTVIRICCWRKIICFSACKNNRSQLDAAATAAAESIAKTALQQQECQSPVMVCDRETHSNSYTIKLIDNDLIVETQESTTSDDSSSETCDNANPTVLTDLVFKSWLLLSNKDSDTHSLIMETKSLCTSPPRTQKQHSPSPSQTETNPQMVVSTLYSAGFGLTQSSDSVALDRFSYTHGNQLEYMGGLYGYVDSAFCYHGRPESSTPRQQLKQSYQNSSSRFSLELVPVKKLRSYSVDLVNCSSKSTVTNNRKLSSV